MANLQQTFFTAYLRKGDCSAALVSQVYLTAKNTAEKLCIEIATVDKFLKSLNFDKNRNVLE